MKNTRKIAQNFIVKLGADLYSRAGMLALVIVIARVYGADAFGKYAVAFTLVNLFYVLTEFGLHTILVRDIARDLTYAHEYWKRFVALKIVLAVFTIVALSITAAIMAYSTEIMFMLAWATVWMIANSCIDSIYAYFTAFEKMRYVLINTLVYRSMLYGIGFPALLIAKVSLVTICGIIAGSSVVGAVYAWYLAGRYIGPQGVAFNKSFMAQRLRDSFPIGSTGIFASIYLRLDTIIISKLRGNLETGIYNSAYKIYETIVFIPSLFQSIILPSLSRYINSDLGRFRFASTRAMISMLALSAPITICLFMKSDWIMRQLYGSDYTAAAGALRIFSPAIILLFVSVIPTAMLIAAGKQRFNAYASFCAMIINAGGNLILIPRFGYTGAAGMIVATQMVFCVLVMKYTWQLFETAYALKSIGKVAIAGVCMLGFLSLFGNVMPPLLLIVIALIIFTVMLFALRLFTVREARAVLFMSEDTRL
jgi:O-antigen/teichoic acid export membrane protein